MPNPRKEKAEIDTTLSNDSKQSREVNPVKVIVPLMRFPPIIRVTVEMAPSRPVNGSVLDPDPTRTRPV